MSRNTRHCSPEITDLAAEILHDAGAPAAAKSLAGCVLAKNSPGEEASPQVGSLAAKVLHSKEYDEKAKKLAGSVLAQARKSY